MTNANCEGFPICDDRITENVIKIIGMHCKYSQNIFKHVPGHEHFIPTKFGKHPLSGSVVKAGYVLNPIHIVHAIMHPPPFHLNKFIDNSLKYLKHLNLLYKHSSNYKHGNNTK